MQLLVLCLKFSFPPGQLSLLLSQLLVPSVQLGLILSLDFVNPQLGLLLLMPYLALELAGLCFQISDLLFQPLVFKLGFL